MKVMFIGAAHEVTGSCTLLEACGKRFLIDCGMEQGENIYENCDLPVAPGEIDAISLLTPILTTADAFRRWSPTVFPAPYI